jgi:uronate dehydrogenase
MSGAIVITGGAGKVVRVMRPYLLERYGALRLTDVVAPSDLDSRESFVPADFSDIDALRTAFRGARAIIHMGGYPRDADWATIGPSNIEGCHNVFEAARLEGVGRIILGSSNHATGLHRTDTVIGSDAPPMPDSLYGVSKVFAEALCTLYSHKHDMRCMVIRIGRVHHEPTEPRMLSVWVHAEDLAQLCAIGIDSNAYFHEIVYGVSATSRSFYDNSTAERLGYRPKHNADDYATSAMANAAPLQGTAGLYQGGTYCADLAMPLTE